MFWCLSSDSCRIRTYDRLFRRELLYPAELTSHELIITQIDLPVKAYSREDEALLRPPPTDTQSSYQCPLKLPSIQGSFLTPWCLDRVLKSWSTAIVRLRYYTRGGCSCQRVIPPPPLFARSHSVMSPSANPRRYSQVSPPVLPLEGLIH